MSDGKINILIVDDKPEKALALEAVLEDLGQNIIRAYSGREALRCLLNQVFAVILLDVNMPGMDGFETAALIRQRPSTQGVPIIFVTAMDDQTHASQGYSLGAVDYIQTPVVPEVLKAKVSVFVELFRKSEQVQRQARSLEQRAGQLHKLAAASLAVHSAVTMEQMFRVLADTARDVTGAQAARAIYFSEPPSRRARIYRAMENGVSERVAELDEAEAEELRRQSATLQLLGRIARKSRQSLLPKLSLSASAGHAPAEWLSAPLLSRDGRNLGLIEVGERTAGQFSQDDEAILVQLAQMGSIAVENTLYAVERESNRIKDEFLSTLSHELRTPLNAILGWTQLLQIGPLPPEVDHGLEVIDRNARAQTKLIEDLLDVSRISTGKLELNLRPTSLGHVVRAAVDAIRPTVEHRQITVGVTLPDSEVIVEGDGDRLQQVVWNLLSNAVKFTPDRGRIEIRLQQAGDLVKLSVTDNGRGINPSFLPFVFDRFKQADSSSTRSHGGLGIGLTIVRHIVQMHHGSVDADSLGEGHGATFTVTLPAYQEELSPATGDASSPRETVAADLTGMRILVVDDEADAREVIAATLAHVGATVSAAGSVDAAMAVIAQNPPDLVISDIAMPVADGYDLIRRVKLLGPEEGGQIPVIALTAYARTEDRERAVAAGFKAHIAKPINPATLISAVRKLQEPALAEVR